MRRIGRWREVRLDRSTAPASTEPLGGSQGPGGSPRGPPLSLCQGRLLGICYDTPRYTGDRLVIYVRIY